MKEYLQSTIDHIIGYLRELIAAPQSPALQPVHIADERPHSKRVPHR